MAEVPLQALTACRAGRKVGTRSLQGEGQILHDAGEDWARGLHTTRSADGSS